MHQKTLIILSLSFISQNIHFWLHLDILHGADNRTDNLEMPVLYSKHAGMTVRGLTKVQHWAQSFKPSRSLYAYTFFSRSALIGEWTGTEKGPEQPQHRCTQQQKQEWQSRTSRTRESNVELMEQQLQCHRSFVIGLISTQLNQRAPCTVFIFPAKELTLHSLF